MDATADAKASSGIEDESAHDWVFDLVMTFFRSPEWDDRVMGFVDTHCNIFVNDEENKFEYTDVHDQFREHVERVITTELTTVGVSLEQFVEACEAARHSRDINKEVVEQILAMDDFLTFKKLMVKRNVELELEALDDLHAAGVPIGAPETDEEAEIQLQRALKESEEMSAAHAASVVDDADRERAHMGTQDVIVPDGTANTELRLRQAMDSSLMEIERMHKEEEHEQLELEKALAESLALEHERLEALRLEREAEEEAEEEAEPGDDAKPARTSDEQPRGMQRSNSSSHPICLNSTTPLNGADADAFADDKAAAGAKAEPSAAKGEAASLAAASAAPTAEAKRGEGAAPLDSAQFKRQAPLGGIKPKGGGLQKLDRLAAPSNLPSLAGKSDALGPLPSLQELQDQMAGRRRAAEEAFARNQELLRERDAQQDRLMSQAGVSKQDMEQRAAHLAQQRDRIVQKKKEERARQVREAQAKREAKSTPGETMTAMGVAAGDGAALLGAGEGAKAAASAAPDAKTEATGGGAAGGGSAIGLALARRMKAELLADEEDRLIKAHEEQIQELDDKLRLVERLREENRDKEQQLARAILLQRKLMAKNVEISAARMKNDEEHS